MDLGPFSGISWNTEVMGSRKKRGLYDGKVVKIFFSSLLAVKYTDVIEFIFDTFIGMYYGSVRKRSTSTLEEIGFFLFFFFF